MAERQELNHDSSSRVPFEWDFREASPSMAQLDAGLSEADANLFLAKFKRLMHGRNPMIAHDSLGRRAILLARTGPATEVYIVTVEDATNWLS